MVNEYFCVQMSVQNGPEPGLPSVPKMRKATSSRTGPQSMNRGKHQAPTALIARRQPTIHRFASFAVQVKIRSQCLKELLLSFLKPLKESLMSNSRLTLRTG